MSFDAPEKQAPNLLPPASSLVRSPAPPPLRAPRTLLSATQSSQLHQSQPHDIHLARLPHPRQPSRDVPRMPHASAPLHQNTLLSSSHKASLAVSKSASQAAPQAASHTSSHPLSHSNSLHVSQGDSQGILPRSLSMPFSHRAPHDQHISVPSTRFKQRDTRRSALTESGAQDLRVSAITPNSGSCCLDKLPPPIATVGFRHHSSGAPESQTFDGLVEQMLAHPALALILRLAFNAGGAGPVSVPDEDGAAETLRNAEIKAREVARKAAAAGIEAACRRISPLDVYLSALWSALNEVQSVAPRLTPALRATLQACGTAGRQTRPVSISPLSSPEEDGSAFNASRSKLSASAKDTLDEWFESHFENPYPSDAEKRGLALRCGLELSQINNYFGNRRMRLKRKIIKKRQNDEAASSGVGGASFETSVLAPRTKWRAIVFPRAGNREAAVLDAPPQHDALVSGIFRGGMPRNHAITPVSMPPQTRYEYDARRAPSQVPSECANRPPRPAPRTDPRYGDAPHPVIRNAETASHRRPFSSPNGVPFSIAYERETPTLRGEYAAEVLRRNTPHESVDTRRPQSE